MKLLLIHGVGYPERPDLDWSLSWQAAITNSLKQCGYGGALEFQAVPYDQIFRDHYHGPSVYAKAIAELLASVAWHALTDPFAHLLHPERAARGLGDEIQSHAGVVAQWVVEDDLRAECRERILQSIDQQQPDVVCAHSLGTLLSYDLFTYDKRGRNAIAGRTYLTCGSQIANPFVRARAWAGRVDMLDGVKFWHHLYNPRDPVFTAPINLKTAPNFRQTTTVFGSLFLDISAHAVTQENGHAGYLDHPNTLDIVWRSLAAAGTSAAAAGFVSRTFQMVSRVTEPPRRRALLIGINDYPDPANRLEGCVNDVFKMSALLQELGFDPEDIRVVLNERATRAGIMERLHWLLDNADDGQERVLFFSGHGAQMPDYGVKDEIDHLDECLVPYDFAWSRETAIIDKDFLELYSQLSYDARFFALFDCCHSGGMTREGGRKVRGLTPPDDIRHRLLRWNVREQMWEERKLPAANADLGTDAAKQRQYSGLNGATNRLGRAMPLRTLPKKEYDQTRKRRGHAGPYLPVLFEACREEQLAYEYRDGVTSYGAFTFALAQNLRRLRDSGRKHPTYNELIKAINATLHNLSYDQTASLIGPDAILNRPIPGRPGTAVGAAAKPSRKK